LSIAKPPTLPGAFFIEEDLLVDGPRYPPRFHLRHSNRHAYGVFLSNSLFYASDDFFHGAAFTGFRPRLMPLFIGYWLW